MSTVTNLFIAGAPTQLLEVMGQVFPGSGDDTCWDIHGRKVNVRKCGTIFHHLTRSGSATIVPDGVEVDEAREEISRLSKKFPELLFAYFFEDEECVFQQNFRQGVASPMQILC